MKRKVTKKVREQAWLICAIAASSGQESPYHPFYRNIAFDLSIDLDARILAELAWDCAYGVHRRWTRETDAEAAALLAEGWTPEGWV